MAKPTSVVETSPEVEAREPEEKSSFPSSGPLNWADERTGLAKIGRFGLRKIFPDHWSFLLGEIALYSFVVLLLTGVFLTIWFKPSMAEIEYDGSYQLLKGMPVY